MTITSAPRAVEYFDALAPTYARRYGTGGGLWHRYFFEGRLRIALDWLGGLRDETIVDVGVQGQADVVEEPRLALDLNYKWFLSDSLTLKAKAGNLLDEVVQFTQGGRVYQEYRQGVTLEAGLDWNF